MWHLLRSSALVSENKYHENKRHNERGVSLVLSFLFRPISIRPGGHCKADRRYYLPARGYDQRTVSRDGPVSENARIREGQAYRQNGNQDRPFGVRYAANLSIGRRVCDV